MCKTIIVILLTISFLAMNLPIAYCAKEDDVQKHEQKVYEQKKQLKKVIKKGQTSEGVLAILGAPEDTQTFQDGSDVVEVWFYDGYDVRIEFRNELISKWFFRFMPDKKQ
jgi:hypothetical protein